MKKIIHFPIHRPITAIVTVLSASILMVLGVRFIHVDDNILNLVPEDIPERQAWEKMEDLFGTSEFIYVAFGHPGQDILNPTALRDLWTLTMALDTLAQVDEVTSLATAKRIESDEGEMVVEDMLPGPSLSSADIQAVKDYLEKFPQLKKQLVGRHGDYLNILIRPLPDADYTSLGLEVTQITHKVLAGLDYEVHFGGQSYLTGIIPKLIREDTSRLIVIGIIVMILLLLINLRSVPAVTLVLVTILLSLGAMMGFMGWVVHFTGSNKFYFSLVNTSMPIILLTIANSYGVHILTHFFREMRRGEGVVTALEKTLNVLYLPVFLTAFTTLVAFFTLLSAPISALTGYGVSIALGVAWAWLLSTVLLPAVMRLVYERFPSARAVRPGPLEKLVDRFGHMVLRHPGRVASGGLLVVLLGAVGFTMLRVEVNIAHFFSPGSQVRESFDFMDQEMAGTLSLVFLFTGDLKSPAVLNDMDRLQRFLEQDPRVTTTFSLADVIKKMHRAIMDDDPRFETIPADRSQVNNLLTLYTMSSDPEDFSSLVDYDYHQGIVTALLQTLSSSEIIKFSRKVTTYMDANLTSGAQIEVTGLMMIFRKFIYLVIRSAAASILFSLLLVAIIVWIFFRRLRWAGASVIPLAVAVILNFGLMGWFHVDLSHITVLLSSIIIGVGVDFAIHYISQFRALAREKVPVETISRRVMGRVGYPIVLDALSNMSFAALLGSSFIPIRAVGGLMVFAMVSTSVGTLSLLAAMIERRRETYYALEQKD